MGYLFAAYTVIWAVVFGYVFVLYLRQRRLSRDIELLKQDLDKQQQG